MPQRVPIIPVRQPAPVYRGQGNLPYRSEEKNRILARGQETPYSVNGAPTGATVEDGDKGDITVSSTGTVWTIDDDVVTYPKIQNVSATDKLLGRSTAGAGDIEEITCTAAGRALLDDADAQAQSKTLAGCYILAQSAVAVAHTGSTTETTLATITVPAGAMGANGRIEIIAVFSYTNSANIKTPRVKFGTALLYQVNATTTASVRIFVDVANRNATNSQVGGPNNSQGFTTSANAVVTAAIDTTAAVDITITGQLASAAETITLQSYRVLLFAKD